MNNVSMMMADGLILRYGYVMQTETVSTTYTRLGAKLSTGYRANGGPLPYAWTASTTRVNKWRSKANPFGFGIDYGGLSFRQMSILAALGITRSARTP